MSRHDLSSESESTLSAYRMPPLTFPARTELPDVLRPFWNVLRIGARPPAALAGEVADAIHREAPHLRAPLYLVLAVCQLRAKNYSRAIEAARESILAHTQQHAAHRILMDAFWEQGAYDDTYFYLSTLATPTTAEAWDELLPPHERHLALAALAWRVQDWNGVTDHLARAFPSGAEQMPVELREDFFRVAVYLGSADEAAAMASSLLPVYEVDHVDQMLRTLDSRGWSSQALELYRQAFARHPANPLLRRRLVGLCIREGQLSEARTLAEGMPLDLAA